ncbi:MAG: hypothetical protein KDI03_04160 [Anaerolineae bacterium]|nr:hypothetical protein [Anaerolineae bacterium]
MTKVHALPLAGEPPAELLRPLFRVYRAALGLLAFFFLLPDFLFVRPNAGLDPSWAIAINLAFERGMRFGEDFIFTFGPLGILSTRLNIGVSPLAMMVWDLFLMGSIAVVLYLTLRETRTYLSVFLVFLAAFLFRVVPPHTIALINTLFVIFLFLLIYHLWRGALWALALAVLYSWLIFFTKANMGLPALALMVVYLAYLVILPRPYGRRPALLAGAGFVILGVVLAVVLNVDMAGFIAGSWHLADAYNDAMALPFALSSAPQEMLPLSLAIIAAFLLLALVNWRTILKNLDFALAYLMIAGYLFLVFKHAYVRAFGHPWYFFQSAPAAIGLLALYARLVTSQDSAETSKVAESTDGGDTNRRGPVEAGNRRLPKSYQTVSEKIAQSSLARWSAGVFLLALLCAFPAGVQLYSTEALDVKVEHLRNYGRMAVSGPPYYEGNPNVQTQALPQSTLDLIGNGSVDVMPWEISTIYFNGLAYDPRPVIQSYTAYDGWLDQRNADKYLSDSAPEFILFSMGDIDGRHPFFTEPRTRRTLLSHYQIVQRTPGFLLLQRREQPLVVTETPGATGTARLGEFIDLEPTDALQFITADIEYSLRGKVERFLYQPKLLWVTLEFEDGETRTYRAVKTMVNDQALVDPFVETLDDAQVYLESLGRDGRRVKRVRFETDLPRAFQPEFTYHITQVVVQEMDAR